MITFHISFSCSIGPFATNITITPSVIRSATDCTDSHQFVAMCSCDWMVSHPPRMLTPLFHSHWWQVWSISIEASEIRRAGHTPVWVSYRQMLSWWRLHGAWRSLGARISSTHRQLASLISPTESWNLKDWMEQLVWVSFTRHDGSHHAISLDSIWFPLSCESPCKSSLQVGSKVGSKMPPAVTVNDNYLPRVANWKNRVQCYWTFHFSSADCSSTLQAWRTTRSGTILVWCSPHERVAYRRDQQAGWSDTTWVIKALHCTSLAAAPASRNKLCRRHSPTNRFGRLAGADWRVALTRLGFW